VSAEKARGHPPITRTNRAIARELLVLW
jgi:hypothetical protein